MLYALANTLVCDSVDEAKALAWGAERQKGTTTFPMPPNVSKTVCASDL